MFIISHTCKESHLTGACCRYCASLKLYLTLVVPFWPFYQCTQNRIDELFSEIKYYNLYNNRGLYVRSNSCEFFLCLPEFGWRYDRFESASLLSLCKPLSLSNFNLFFVCSLTRRLQDCFNKTLIHWRPWWMIWIGRYLIRCGWHNLNLSFIFYLNIRKQNKCFTTRLRWSAMKPALPLVKKKFCWFGYKNTMLI